MTQLRTRFAPSPNGLLHLGHVWSALCVWETAATLGAEVLLRIEDTDFTRCRPEFEAAMMDDLAWLGFQWSGEVLRQSERSTFYEDAIESLKQKELLYPCRCTRKEMEAAWKGAPVYGPEGLRYAETCKGQSVDLAEPVAWRLDMAKALQQVKDLEVPLIGGVLEDLRPVAEAMGDVILVRKDIGGSYHVSVVIDDALQAISHVVRGEDMREATAIHGLLQALLGLPTPVYQFHNLITDDEGRKLAKRDGDEGLAKLRERGFSPEQVLALARQRAA